MKLISFTATGLSPTETYRVEVYKASTPNVLYFVKHNISHGQLITFPADEPTSYIVRLFGMMDTNGVCLPDEYNEKIINVLYPILSFNVGEVDCNSEMYNVSFTITNPNTSPLNIEYGWSYSNSCSSVTNWSIIPNFNVASDGNDIFFFVRYNLQDTDSCCELITTTNRPPCINCKIEIENIAVTCGNDPIPPQPEGPCLMYRLDPGSSGTMYDTFVYTPCDSDTIEHGILQGAMFICSKTYPVVSDDVIVEVAGGCPS